MDDAVAEAGTSIFFNGSVLRINSGGSGTLRLYQDGFDGDNDLENGTYTLRVDLANATYSYTPVE